MLGLLGMLVGGSMLFSLPWAFPICGQTTEFERDGFFGLVASILCSLALGGTMYYVGRSETGGILRKEALAIVGLGWMLAGMLGALPFLFSGVMCTDHDRMSVVDAVFESVSGFTTTGASVLTQLEDPGRDDVLAKSGKLIPRCVLFWRSFTHWLGGMGIIVLFVAILGQLGAGGKALMRREVPGPINEAVRPRVRETALMMWAIYVGLSAILVVVLMLERMSLFDALCHSFGTMATGGFSTYNASVGHFHSPLIEYTLLVFMIAAGTNFALYYLALQRIQASGGWRLREALTPFFRDAEYRVYLGILLCTTCIIAFSLWRNEQYSGLAETIRHAAFTSVSIMTTTGFGTEDFHQWSQFIKGLLLLLMFIGGCAGSTGGGMKVIRFMLFARIVRLEVEQSFRPNVVRPLTLFGTPVDNALRHSVMVYFSLVLMIFISSWMILAAIEPDEQWGSVSVVHATDELPPVVNDHAAEKLLDCASAVAATLNNIGPGLGVLGPHSNYSQFSPQGKLLLTMLMLLGRLELFAILVFFVPSFWKVQ
jgi:trk system potassium uptake protein TrkH